MSGTSLFYTLKKNKNNQQTNKKNLFRTHFNMCLHDVCLSCHTAQSCEEKCGEYIYASCSCHPTCDKLGTCCDDFKQYCVDMLPYSGTIMGGTDFKITVADFAKNSTVICRLVESSFPFCLSEL